ncbi:hypothetical protein [uncultured Bilophila sp.]|uniref:hypothetical protein n=1 Tax=uncultured Bilophila sp. TaxID=529385 RepID=UPI00280AA3E3|nr:hypothetical protein [uncultured Bilophila sp.]
MQATRASSAGATSSSSYPTADCWRDLRDHDASIPAPLDRARSRGGPLRPSAPPAHAKLVPCLFHALLGAIFAPIICARREADLSLIEAVELGAVAGLALIYPFYILCRTLEKESTLKIDAPDQRRKGSQETEE